jgi:hypothetical protein
MGLEARKIPAGWARVDGEALAREARRETLVTEPDNDPAGVWRGLLFAVLLAVPFWIALYLLLRWLVS